MWSILIRFFTDIKALATLHFAYPLLGENIFDSTDGQVNGQACPGGGGGGGGGGGEPAVQAAPPAAGEGQLFTTRTAWDNGFSLFYVVSCTDQIIPK